MKKFITFIIIAALLGVGGYFAFDRWQSGFFDFFGRQEAFAETIGPLIIPGIVMRTNVREIISSAGVVHLESTKNILSESTERIRDVFFEEGDWVEAGQVVVVYDVSDTVTNLERRLAEAQISLENAELNLLNLSLPRSEAEMQQFRNAVTNAEKSVFDSNIALQNIEKDISVRKNDIERAETAIANNEALLRVGAITNEEYLRSVSIKDDMLSALGKLMLNKESGEMNLLMAENNLLRALRDLERAGEVLVEESERIRFRQQENAVRSARLHYEDIKNQLSLVIYRTVADVSGTVISVFAERGRVVSRGSPLVTVSDFDNLIVKSDISEFDAPKMAVGQTVYMTSDGIAGIVYEGTIKRIASTASTRNIGGGAETVVGIEIAVNNPDGILKPGYNLDLDIITADKENILAISQSAVRRDNISREHYVYTVDSEDIARRTVVILGLYGDLNVEVLSGLREGDRIIISPQPRIRDGFPINQSMEAENTRRGFFRNDGTIFNVGGLIPTPRPNQPTQQMNPGGGGRGN